MNHRQLKSYKACDLPVRIFHWVNFSTVIGLILFGLLLYRAYILMLLIVVHILAVVFAGVREGGSIISAMFSGNRVLPDKPVDDNA